MKSKKSKSKPIPHVYLIDVGDRIWCVASSARKAWNLYMGDPKMTLSKYLKEWPDTTVTQCDDDKEFTITSRAEDTGKLEDEHETMTFGEWAKTGEGLLAQSDY